MTFIELAGDTLLRSFVYACKGKRVVHTDRQTVTCGVFKRLEKYTSPVIGEIAL